MVGIGGLGLIILSYVVVVNRIKLNNIEKNRLIVPGVVVCVQPVYGKSHSYLCYQFQYSGKLYCSATPIGQRFNGVERGHYCTIAIDSLNPRNEKFQSLRNGIGRALDPKDYRGDVIWIEGECGCEENR